LSAADIDKLEEFAPRFAEHLRNNRGARASWPARPGNTGWSARFAAVAVPLLLNSRRRVRKDDINLGPAKKFAERLRRLHQQFEAGSPRPQFELEFDPLGLIGPALSLRGKQRDRGRSALAQQTGDARSPRRDESTIDRRLRVPGVDARSECVSRRGAKGWDGGPLQILVTGRSASVAEISLSMRHDVTGTLLGSVLP